MHEKFHICKKLAADYVPICGTSLSFNSRKSDAVNGMVTNAMQELMFYVGSEGVVLLIYRHDNVHIYFLSLLLFNSKWLLLLNGSYTLIHSE